jgi:hypothetical protein
MREMREIAEEPPAITGFPVIDGPEMLEWPADREEEGPLLADPTANLVNDLHAEIVRCDMVLATSGNYHMALRELWGLYLAKFPADAPLRNWLYTTSPPLAKQQIERGLLRIGNVTVHCRPQMAVGPRAHVESLAASGFVEGDFVTVCKSRGNALLVKKGNPKEIFSIWDLARKDVRVVTPNPSSEPGSFRLYADSLYGIARHDRNPPRNMSAADLFHRIFNRAGSGYEKWLAGRRIHHREVPWSIAYGKGDAAVLFYHLAAHAASTFPDLFEVVPLGGTPGNPKPLPGNLSEILYAAEIKGEWSAKQRAAREKLLGLFRSTEWIAILERYGLDFPDRA